MLPVFIRQQIRFKIYIIEQVPDTTFNRAKLFNVGYDLAKNDPAGIKWDCYLLVFRNMLEIEKRKIPLQCVPKRLAGCV